jgi:hypothetical protein
MLLWLGLLFGVWNSLQSLESMNTIQPTWWSPYLSRQQQQCLYQGIIPTLAGTLGGSSATFAKAAIELLKTTWKGKNQFIYITTYVILFLLITFLSGQIYFLNASLARFPAMFVVPVYQVFWILCGILGGLFYFNEAQTFTWIQWVMFPLGSCIAILGIILLLFRKGDALSNPETKEDEDLTNWRMDRRVSITHPRAISTLSFHSI